MLLLRLLTWFLWTTNSLLSKAVKIARHGLGIAKQNIAFAIGIKVAILTCCLGLAPMWLVFGTGVMVFRRLLIPPEL